MSLSSPAVIAAEIVADIQALDIVAGTPVTDSQILAIWTAVVTRIYNDLKANAVVEVGTFEAPPGTSGGPLTGTGGPLS